MNELAVLISNNNFSGAITEKIKDSIGLSNKGVSDFFDFLSSTTDFLEHPVLTTGKYLGVAFSAAREKHLINQTYRFIMELNSEKIVDERKFLEFKGKFEVDSQFRNDLLDRITYIIDRSIDSYKATVVAKLLKTYINQDISCDEFYELTEILDRLLFSDCELMKKIFSGFVENSKQCENYQCKRLEALGLIELNINTVYVDRTEYSLTITKIGNILCKFGLC